MCKHSKKWKIHAAFSVRSHWNLHSEIIFHWFSAKLDESCTGTGAGTCAAVDSVVTGTLTADGTVAPECTDSKCVCPSTTDKITVTVAGTSYKVCQSKSLYLYFLLP